MRFKYIIAILLMMATTTDVAAQALQDRFTKERPVVIVCDKNNPPYEFVNEKGVPAGTNVDVMKAVLDGLNLNHVFVMKEKQEKKQMLETGEADLMMADSVGNFHFVGKDRQLIDQMDDQFERLREKGQIAKIRKHWLHPELDESEPAIDLEYVIGGALILTVILLILSLVANLHIIRIKRHSKAIYKMMYKALHMGNYNVMQYDIKHDLFTNQYGSILPDSGIGLGEYMERVDQEYRVSFSQKMHSLMEGREQHFELSKRWNQGTAEAPVYKYLQVHAICENNKLGYPAYIINAMNDVTKEMEITLAAQDLEHQLKVIITNPFVGISFLNSKGEVIVQNEAMKRMGSNKGEGAMKHIQPLYNAKGEVSSYLVTKEA